MEDLVVTETETTEPSVGVEEVVTNSINDMSDEEFTKEFDGDSTAGDAIDDSTDKPDSNVTLNDMYSKQLSNIDAKLDSPVLIKIDGEVMELNSINELRDMAERGTKVTQKFQKLAEDRKALEAQLQALGETPDVSDDSSSEIDTIANGILQSSYVDSFKTDVSNLPSEVRETLSTDPQILKGLSMDYESGLAQQIMPKVKREMTVKGLDFIQAYVSVGRSIQSQKENVQSKKQMLTTEPKQNKYTTESKAIDIDSMSDTEFDTYFSNI